MRLLMLLYLLFSGVFGNAQLPGAEVVFRERFSLLRQNSFQEKVYLHTDRSHYVAGEYLWFRAFRTDAATHQPAMYSRFVYVELYDARDRLVNRIKVMEREGVFAGSFPLDPYLPTGRYTLRAYTYWMQNFDEAFYFRKEITVENLRSGVVRHEVVWDTTSTGDWRAAVRFLPIDGKAYPKLFVDCRQYQGQREVRRSVHRSDPEGLIEFRLRRQDSVTGLRLQFLDKKPFEYQLVLQVPVRALPEDTDVRFFPEGGDLLENVSSRVGFKAVGPDGYGVDVSGEVFREDGVVVGSFLSAHLGMGRFSLVPEPGRRYYTEVHLPGGGTKRIDLPEVKREGVVLHAETVDSALCYTCFSTPGYLSERELFLLVHSRGVLLSVMRVEEGWRGMLPLKALPAGIVHGVLADASGRIYSSRLSFVYPSEEKSVSLAVDRSDYGKRDSVQLSLCWDGPDSLSCCLSVTDSALVARARWGSDIVNYFLLDSDLRGYVENPGWYFDPRVRQLHRERMLDILLSTQGWERFDVGRICRNERDTLPFFLELAQGFSGRVRNFWGKNLKDGMLCVLAPRIGYLERILPDSNGYFSFNLSYPDSTEFIFQAFNSRKRKWAELEIHPDSLRELMGGLQWPLVWKPGITEELDTLRPERVKTLGYFYENGRKIYRLEEAVVAGKRNRASYEYIAEQILEARDLKEEKFKTILDWVLTIPGVHVVSDGVRRIVYKGDPLKWNYNLSWSLKGLDSYRLKPASGQPKEMQPDWFGVMQSLTIDKVARLAYVVETIKAGRKFEDIMIIIIELKEGAGFDDGLKGLDFCRFTSLGYHKPVEFYVPRYEVEEERRNPEPDERPTLYWNPDVRLEKGKAETLRFFTTDLEGPFTVTVEGITPEGKVVRSVLNIKNNR